MKLKPFKYEELEDYEFFSINLEIKKVYLKINNTKSAIVSGREHLIGKEVQFKADDSVFLLKPKFEIHEMNRDPFSPVK